MKNTVLLCLLNTQILFCIGGHSSIPKVTLNSTEQEYLKRRLELEREELEEVNKLLNNPNASTVLFYQKFKSDNDEDDETIELYMAFLKRKGSLGVQRWVQRLPNNPEPIPEKKINSVFFLQPSL